MKRLLAVVSGLVFTVGMAAQAVAYTPVGAEKGKTAGHMQHQGGKECSLKLFLQQSLKANQGDLTKVKADVDKMVADKKALHETRLKERAAKEGLSVDELKTKMQAKRAARLEQMAKQHNMSVAEFKAQMQAKRDSGLKSLASDLGLTVDQVKQILPTWPQK
ncbi:MAG: hypothetical protein M0Z55_04695 [Peptococcaceae bacterium]|nr:hypothetical protein [Peptococcaceae bacterium]